MAAKAKPEPGTALTTTEQKSASVLLDENAPLPRIFDQYKGSIEKALRGDVGAEPLIRGALLQVAMTPALTEVAQTRKGKMSIIQAVMQAAGLGLMVGGPAGEAALVPYKGEAKLLPMVRGLVTLAVRSGAVNSVNPVAVYEGDFFEVMRGTNPGIVHKPDLDADREDVKKIKYVYAVFHMKHGPPHFEVMNRKEIERVRATSKAKDDGPWVQWWDQMALKTVTKRGQKSVPLSPEFNAAIELDNRYETGKINQPSALLDSIEDVQGHVIKATGARATALRESLAAGVKLFDDCVKPGDGIAGCEVKDGKAVHVGDCPHFSDDT